MPIIGTDENGWEIYDERVAEVNVPCGQCIECRQAKARNWMIRLHEELRSCNYPYFITLTFSPQKLGELRKELNLNECNALAGKAVRRSLERWRKDHKKSLRHWYITELGHEGTERIHLHGLIFSEIPLEFTKSKQEHYYHWKYWKYGLVYVGDYCNKRTINYIVKYVTKIDTDHKGFIGQVLCSPGMGREYVQRPGVEAAHKYRPKNTIDYYRLNNGQKVKLPTYYKNKFVNEDQRELIWREFMDRDQTAVMGIVHDNRRITPEILGNIVNKAQERSRFYGYGDDSQEWKKKPWNVTERMLKSEINAKNS